MSLVIGVPGNALPQGHRGFLRELQFSSLIFGVVYMRGDRMGVVSL